MPICQKPKGIIMIMSVLVISAVFGAAVTFAAILVSQLQQSRLADQSVQAYYLAESGAERALYQARRRQAVANCCLFVVNKENCDTCPDRGFCLNTEPADSIACINSNKGSLDAELRGGWQIGVGNEKETTANLAPGESLQLDLFNPYYGGENLGTIGAFSINTEQTGTLYGELTNLSWLVSPNGTLSCPQSHPYSPTISRGLVTVGGATNDSVLTGLHDLTGKINVLINPACSYVLRLSNNWFGAALLGFTLRVYQDTGGRWEQADIPSRLVIDSTATYGNSQQKIRVRTPMRPPLSGLYDFVIFSEEQLIK